MNVIEIFAKFVVDTSDFDKGLDQASNKASSVGSSIAKGLGGAALGAATALASAGVAAATAVGAVAKQATDAYSEYQQFVGGIETLFGAGGKSIEEYAASVNKSVDEIEDEYNQLIAVQDLMLDNAANAYKTAGLSANQYMDTAISFSGALLKSAKDAQEGAELTQMAIEDMADQANKYGKSVDDVRVVYSGLSRGIYTTLDNLYGGMFAGTKSGMEELLKYAENYRAGLGEVVDYSIDSYADIVKAMHDVSEALGVSGTTAAEAGETVSGSMSQMKAAWDNLILGLADPNADLGALIDNMVQSAKGALGNMIPVFTQAVKGVGSLVGEIAPVITAELQGIIDEVLPPLLDAVESLLSNVASAIPGFIGSIVDQIPKVLESLMSVVGTLGSSLGELLTTILSPDTFTAIASTISSLLENITGGMSSALTSILQGLPQFISNIITGLSDSAEIIVGMIPTVLDNIGQAIIDNAPVLEETVEKVIPMIWQAMLDMASGATSIMGDIITALTKPDGSEESTFADTITQVFDSFMSFVENELPKWMEKTAPIAAELWGTIAKLIGVVAEKINEFAEPLADVIPDIVETLVTVLTDSGVIDILLDGWVQIFEAVAKESPKFTEPLLKIVPKLLTSLTKALIRSLPTIISGLGELMDAIVKELPALWEIFKATAPELWEAFKSAWLESAVDWGEVFTELWNNIYPHLEEAFNTVKETVTGFVGGILDDAKTSISDKIESVLQPILDFFAPFIEKLMPLVDSAHHLFLSLVDLVYTIFRAIQITVEEKMDEIWTKISDIWQKIVDFVSPILDTISEKVTEIWTSVYDFISEKIDTIKTAAEEGFQQFYEFIEGPLTDAKQFIEDTFNSISEFITGFIDEAKSWGEDMIDNFIGGMTDKMDNLSNASDDLAQSIRNKIGFSEPKYGPLADFHTYAPDMMELFAQGIRDNTSVVDRAINDAFNFGGDIKGSMPGGNVSGLITPTAGRDLTVILQVNEEQLGKVVYRLNNNETQRVGVDLGKAVMA